MATKLVTLDQDAILSEIDIALLPIASSKVSVMLRPYGAGIRSLTFSRWTCVWLANGGLHRRMPKPYGVVAGIPHDGEVLEIDPPRPLVYTWFVYTWFANTWFANTWFANFHTDPKHRSMVRWEPTPTNSGPQVKVTDSGLITEPAACVDYAGGGPGVLEESKTLAESESGRTSMTTTIVTPDQDAIVTEIQISAPPERVFQAISDAGQLERWFTSPECPVKFWKMDARVGGQYSYATDKGSVVVNGVNEFECHGEILECDPPRLLVYTWIGNWHDDPGIRTVVRWALTPKANGTHVRVIHSGLSNLRVARKDYTGGWPGVVEQLKKFVEQEK